VAVRGVAYDDVRVLRFPWRAVGRALLVALAVVIGGFVVTNTYTVLWQQHLEGEWADLVTAGGEANAVPSEPVAKIIIPALEVDRVVLEGQDRATLRKAPGHVPGSALPGQEGNSVIRGHRLLWSGPFRDLDQLNLGSEIHVQTVDGTAVYLVAGMFRQDGDRVDLFQDTALPYLTLVTADPMFRANGVLIVRAALVELNGRPL
jgi:LPXTG-site transpeptidase (sortase) family protein